MYITQSNQSGFRSGHSTKTALLSVVEALRLARAASNSSLLIMLDLSAGFDMVNHQILQSTLLKGQEPHSCGLNLTSQIGPLRYLEEVMYPSRNI